LQIIRLYLSNLLRDSIFRVLMMFLFRCSTKRWLLLIIRVLLT
jgi:hypothetical protein